jgi:hypothetical protein
VSPNHQRIFSNKS